MKVSILVVILDFLVCSLLLFVIGTGGKQTQFATSAEPKAARATAEEFAPAAIQAQQDEWNRGYEQQEILTKLNTETTENEQLRARLNQTSATLAAREANLKSVSEEKTRVEQAKAQTEQALSTVETQLTRVSAEREKLQQEGTAAKGQLAALQTEQTELQQEKTELQQRAAQLGETVASQQSTIGTLAGEVRASQARVEAQLAEVTGVRENQQAMQDNLAALAEMVKALQAEMNPAERQQLMTAVAGVAKGQQDMQGQLDTLVKSGNNEKVAQSLGAIQTGQDALREQTAKLSGQVEAIRARKPGPYKAVKASRVELLSSIAQRDNRDVSYQFKSATYPPVVEVDGHSFTVASSQSLGFNWWALDSFSRVTDLQYSVGRQGETPSATTVATSACALRADSHVVSIELDHPVPGLTPTQLADAGVLQSDQSKFQIFKSTAAGLSFEVDTSPDLADARYLVVKRSTRGVASWFENPAYRADLGDYMVTTDGKLIGIMVSRERCFILTKDNLTACAATVPLADKQQFVRAVKQFQRLK